mgnify:CR=1 FL=1
MAKKITILQCEDNGYCAGHWAGMLWPEADIRFISPAKLIEGERLKTTADHILFMPGIPAKTYRQALGQSGAAVIKRFVDHGGTYVGLCGGGMYAADTIVYHDKITKGLGLFSGRAYGSLQEITGYRYDRKNPRSVGLTGVALKNGKSVHLFYAGGAKFSDFDENRVTVLARYASVDQGRAPAVIESRYGAGRVFLLGVHPDINAHVFDQSSHALHDNINGLLMELKNRETERVYFDRYFKQAVSPR